MRVFLDFEASSLAALSYPIEVGWVGEDGAAEAHLIRPAPGWTDWDARAEALHGISRTRLEAEGEPHRAVAARMVEALSGRTAYASAPSWDGKWLSTLLRAAGLPRHALRLRKTDEALVEAARGVLAPQVPAEQLHDAVQRVIGEARDRLAAEPPVHRALADAERERRLWLEVRRLSEAAAQTRSKGAMKHDCKT